MKSKLFATTTILTSYIAHGFNLNSRQSCTVNRVLDARIHQSRSPLSCPSSPMQFVNGNSNSKYIQSFSKPKSTQQLELASIDAGTAAESLSSADTKTSTKLITGTMFFFTVDYILRKIFRAKAITFPSMMAGCVLIFTSLISMEIVQSGLGDSIFDYLTPSSDMLVKWLPVFFVPGLAMLPLAPKLGSAVDVAKMLALVLSGFFFTLLSTSYAVLGIRMLQGKISKEDNTIIEESAPVSTTTSYEKPYSEALSRNLIGGSVIFGILSIILSKIGHTTFLTPIQTLFMACTTVGAYTFGGNLPPSVTGVLHPIATSTFFTWATSALYAFITGSTFATVLQCYKVNNFHPMAVGAGDLILYMLGPGVCCLSVSMYSRKKLMKDNLLAVIVGMLVSSVGGIVSSALYARYMNLPGAIIRLSVITRNVTTALAMALTSILGGNTSIVASVLVTTGIFGSTIGARFMNAINLKDPISRGLGMGAAAQGIGVAGMRKEKDALPFAAINMIMTALCSSVLISIPVFRNWVKAIALGGL